MTWRLQLSRSHRLLPPASWRPKPPKFCGTATTMQPTFLPLLISRLIRRNFTGFPPACSRIRTQECLQREEKKMKGHQTKKKKNRNLAASAVEISLASATKILAASTTKISRERDYSAAALLPLLISRLIRRKFDGFPPASLV